MNFVTFHADFGRLGDPRQASLVPPARAGATHHGELIELMGRSAALFHPGAELALLTNEDFRQAPPDFEISRFAVRAETLMLDRANAQRAYVEQSDFARPMVLLDTDILLNDSLTSLFEDDFDVAVTWREDAGAPINGGFIALNNRRPERAREFFSGYADFYARTYGSDAAWQGDQLALRDYIGVGLERLRGLQRAETRGATVAFLPCDRFNFSPDNRAGAIAERLTDKAVLHFKGARKWLMPLYWSAHLAPLERPLVGRWSALKAKAKLRRLVQIETADPADTDPASPVRRFSLGQHAAANWFERAERCADLIDTLAYNRRGPLRVADVGCGDQKLKAILTSRGTKIRYTGYDLYPQFKSVQRLDIDKEIPGKAADVVVLLGVVEYLRDVEGALRRLRGCADNIVLSHAVSEANALSAAELERRGWRNQLSTAEMDTLLDRCGWAPFATSGLKQGRIRLWLARARG